MIPMKVAFVGESAVGKTSLIKAFMGESIAEVRSTRGVDFYTFTKDNYKIVVWDFAGQEWFRKAIIDLLKGASLVVLVFDLSRPETLESLLSTWADHITKFAGKDTTVIVVGNKRDIKKIDDETVEKAIDELKKKINVKFYLQTSALLKENVGRLFDMIFEYVKLNEFLARKKKETL